MLNADDAWSERDMPNDTISSVDIWFKNENADFRAINCEYHDYMTSFDVEMPEGIYRVK